jgi:hypothetical protein
MRGGGKRLPAETDRSRRNYSPRLQSLKRLAFKREGRGNRVRTPATTGGSDQATEQSHSFANLYKTSRKRLAGMVKRSFSFTCCIASPPIL